MRLGRNNNTKVVNSIAKSSVKNSKMRNFFIVFTIALSVSLLMVMSLYTVGFEVSEKRQVAKMQHAIYEEVTKSQIESLKNDERVDMLMLNKIGKGMDVDNKLIQPIWNSEDAIKGNRSDVDTTVIREGKMPEAINEIAVSKEYCESIGKEQKPGTEVSLKFLDGKTEKFIISGIIDMAENTRVYPIYFSESYAMNGTQLKRVKYDAIVRIYGADEMSQNKFLKEIRDIADKSGIERKQVNENNNFVDTLSGGERQSQQIIVIVCLSIGILFVSVLVIYSVFYLSVIGRIRQFGQLRTIGMTKRQIKRMITIEGLSLSAMGIPIGILGGGIIGYLVQKSGWDFKNTCIIAGIVAIADIITVLISIHNPGKIASSISPIDAAKYTGYKDSKEKLITKKLYRKLTPLSLAKMSASRNRKKTLLTTLSLGVGGVLFIIATTVISSTSLEGYSRQGDFQFGEFSINLSYNAAETAEHGLTDLQMDNPLNRKLTSKIEGIDGVKKVTTFGKVETHWEANGELEKDCINGFSKGEISEELLETGDIDYDKMVGNNEILFYGNSIFKEIFGWNYKLGDKVKLTVFNGNEEVGKEYTIVGFVKSDYSRNNPECGWFLMPQGKLDRITDNMNLATKIIISTEEGKREPVEAELQQIVDDNTLLTMDTLEEQQEIDEKNFSMIFSMILGLSIFIIGFSMINLINTLITNVVTRKQEFAMLQSIGMTNGQSNKMVQVEGLLLSLGNLAITLIIGIPMSYGGIELLRYFGADYMHYTFPTWFFLGYVVLIVLVPIVVSTIVLNSFKKQSLVERLRIVD